MKNLISFLTMAIMVIALPVASLAQENQENEKEAIKNVIVSAYVDGIFNEGNVNKIKAGWYPECDINIYNEINDTCTKSKAFRFIPMFERNPVGLTPGTTYKIPMVHITGYAAIAIVEIYHKEKQIYTDYMNLYKFRDGWKIVTKTFYAFPK
ncbi:MAG: hypothetical protein CVU00_02770 [Bacteroidetes bacterium HGW-Bacteroidetes-17]|jgi:hypothetical protein|nr:MAG: hypothetical protein CVU00_02770 [Bacteroidetes bacterium HGW-Bacteroidetes-17]